MSNLPVGWLEDSLLPRMDASEVADRIMAMTKREDATYLSINYLKNNANRSQLAVDESCRVKMCKWFYQIIDFCKFRRELVSISMSILDRFLSTEQGRYALFDRKDYQLVAMTALYMAIKLHESIEMETSLIVDLSRGCYNEEDIASTERDILDALNWKIHPPTTLIFCAHFLALIPDSIGPHSEVTQALMDHARYQIELAASDYRLVDHKFSHMALAAVLNAVEGMDSSLFNVRQKGLFIRNIEKYSCILVEDVTETQEILDSIMMEIYRDEIFSESINEPLSPRPMQCDTKEQSDILMEEKDNDREVIQDQKDLSHCKSPVSVTGSSSAQIKKKMRKQKKIAKNGKKRKKNST